MAGSEHPNVTLVREGFEAMNRGDMTWMQEHVADDIVWHVGGDNRMSGAFRGKDKVMQMMGSMGSGEMTASTHDIVGNDDHVVVLGTAKVSAGDGDTVEYNYVNVFHIQDGKATEVWGMSEDDSKTDPVFDKLGS
ncbi:MAG: nuclear transport factor 2 family protein [Actinomycetota bacterium]